MTTKTRHGYGAAVPDSQAARESCLFLVDELLADPDELVAVFLFEIQIQIIPYSLAFRETGELCLLFVIKKDQRKSQSLCFIMMIMIIIIIIIISVNVLFIIIIIIVIIIIIIIIIIPQS